MTALMNAASDLNRRCGGENAVIDGVGKPKQEHPAEPAVSERPSLRKIAERSDDRIHVPEELITQAVSRYRVPRVGLRHIILSQGRETNRPRH